MMKRTQLILVLAMAGLIGALPAKADERTDDGIDRTRELPTDISQLRAAGLNPTMRGEIAFKGTVMGQDREPIPGIRVLLFIGGRAVEEHNTDGVGQYDFARTIDFSRDETVLLWFEDPTRLRAPKAFVLAESQAALEHGLLSPCLTRLQVEATIESTIYLFDEKTKAAALVDRKCL
jgi:hypothetical protein